jgi:hypothetical protein
MFRRSSHKLVNLLGLPIMQHRGKRSWSFFDGTTLHVSNVDDETFDHEVGHFLAATKKERKLPEWGLGRGPEFPSDDELERCDIVVNIPRRLHENRTTAEDRHQSKKESTASIYGIAVTYVFGKKNEWREHAHLHGWDDAEHACDLPCLIRPTEHYDLKAGLTKVLARLKELKGRQ